MICGVNCLYAASQEKEQPTTTTTMLVSASEGEDESEDENEGISLRELLADASAFDDPNSPMHRSCRSMSTRRASR